MTLTGMKIDQNDTTLKYLKLYPDSKTTTSISLNLRLNITDYYYWVSSYLLVIDELYGNSLKIAKYY
jgi:hypothetical protein